MNNSLVENQTTSKHIICPFCHRKLIKVEERGIAEKIRFVFPNSRHKADWHIKCTACGRQVGMTLSNVR